MFWWKQILCKLGHMIGTESDQSGACVTSRIRLRGRLALCDGGESPFLSPTTCWVQWSVKLGSAWCRWSRVYMLRTWSVSIPVVILLVACLRCSFRRSHTKLHRRQFRFFRRWAVSVVESIWLLSGQTLRYVSLKRILEEWIIFGPRRNNRCAEFEVVGGWRKREA